VTTTARPLAAPADPAPAGRFIDCDACALFGTDPWPTAAAEHLAAVHDDMHHRGRPTATVRPA